MPTITKPYKFGLQSVYIHWYLLCKDSCCFKCSLSCCSLRICHAGHCDPIQKDARVQQFMWSGNKHNDFGVPLNAADNDRLTQTKSQQWHEQPDPYSTTKAVAGRQVTSALAAGVQPKREACRWGPCCHLCTGLVCNGCNASKVRRPNVCHWRSLRGTVRFWLNL